jgi:A nuclease family of the HNH/ENDO VII superfamily with conserved AHH
MNGRLYDPVVGRMLSVDNYVSDGSMTQAYNRYAYALNNPLKYTDPDGELPIVPILAAAIGGGLNLWSNWGKVTDLKTGLGYFGVGAVAGFVSISNPAGARAIAFNGNVVMDGLTGNLPDGNDILATTTYVGLQALNAFGVAGSGKLAKAGVGLWRWAERSVVTKISVAEVDELGRLLADQFPGEKLVTNTAQVTQVAVKVPAGEIGKVAAGQVAKGGASKLPTQIHHFATNKHSVFTKQMSSIAQKYGLDLNGTWNKAAMPHLGRHPNEYHKFVLQGMERASLEAGSNQAKFLQLFDQYVKQPVLQNPNLLRKSGW